MPQRSGARRATQRDRGTGRSEGTSRAPDTRTADETRRTAAGHRDPDRAAVSARALPVARSARGARPGASRRGPDRLVDRALVSVAIRGSNHTRGENARRASARRAARRRPREADDRGGEPQPEEDDRGAGELARARRLAERDPRRRDPDGRDEQARRRHPRGGMPAQEPGPGAEPEPGRTITTYRSARSPPGPRFQNAAPISCGPSSASDSANSGSGGTRLDHTSSAIHRAPGPGDCRCSRSPTRRRPRCTGARRRTAHRARGRRRSRQPRRPRPPLPRVARGRDAPRGTASPARS